MISANGKDFIETEILALEVEQIDAKLQIETEKTYSEVSCDKKGE